MYLLADDLKNFRKEKRYSQKDIADLLGIPRTTWANYESEKVNIPFETMIKLEELGFRKEGSKETIVGSLIKKNIYEIPLLTKEQVMAFNPRDEIPEPLAHSGEYPEIITVPIPHWLKEFSTDLRAITVFNSRMEPKLSSGDVAIFEATGWNGNGIYLYRFENSLHITYANFENGRFILSKEFKAEEQIIIDIFDAIGRVRAVIKKIDY